MDKLSVEALLSLEYTIAAPLFETISYPFEVLPFISDYIKELSKTLDMSIYEKKGDNIYIARSANVAETAVIKEPCIICAGATVGNFSVLREGVIVGRDCVVGNSVELKNTILFDGATVPAFNYVGDSILGYRSNLGAGAITANVKSDKTLVTVKSDDSRMDTGLNKFGAIVGDFVEVGCSAVLNAGTVIGKNTNIYPLSNVRGYIPANRIYKNVGEIVEKL